MPAISPWKRAAKALLSLRALAVLLAVIFVLSCVPILRLGFSARPLADDYSYGRSTHEVWLQTHSIIEVIKQAAQVAKSTFYGWQGSYSAVFLMCLNPLAFGEGHYWFTAVFLLAALVLGSALFFAACTRLLRGRWYHAMLLSALILAVQVHFIPSPRDGFYWFNGAVYYLFFHSVAMAFLGLLLLLFDWRREKRGWLFNILAVLTAGVGLFLGGGNYATALVTVLLAISLCIVAMCTKTKAIKLTMWIITVCLLAGLLISALAPGNAARAQSAEGMTPLAAIWAGLQQGIEDVGTFTSLPLILISLALIPLYWHLVRRGGGGDASASALRIWCLWRRFC